MKHAIYYITFAALSFSFMYSAIEAILLLKYAYLTITAGAIIAMIIFKYLVIQFDEWYDGLYRDVFTLGFSSGFLVSTIRAAFILSQ